jgi:hypothetical protein
MVFLLSSCSDSSEFNASASKKKTRPVENVEIEPEEEKIEEEIASFENVLPETPAQSNKVTKGIFTVWSEPSNPKPFEDYDIFVLVAGDDLEPAYIAGSITGSDTFYDVFGGKNTAPRLVEEKDDSLLVKHSVPGGASRVKDNIKVSVVKFDAVHDKYVPRTGKTETIELYFGD